MLACAPPPPVKKVTEYKKINTLGSKYVKVATKKRKIVNSSFTPNDVEYEYEAECETACATIDPLYKVATNLLIKELKNKKNEDEIVRLLTNLIEEREGEANDYLSKIITVLPERSNEIDEAVFNIRFDKALNAKKKIIELLGRKKYILYSNEDGELSIPYNKGEIEKIGSSLQEEFEITSMKKGKSYGVVIEVWTKETFENNFLWSKFFKSCGLSPLKECVDAIKTSLRKTPHFCKNLISILNKLNGKESKITANFLSAVFYGGPKNLDFYPEKIINGLPFNWKPKGFPDIELPILPIIPKTLLYGEKLLFVEISYLNDDLILKQKLNKLKRRLINKERIEIDRIKREKIKKSLPSVPSHSLEFRPSSLSTKKEKKVYECCLSVE